MDSLHLLYLKRKRSQGTNLGSGSPWAPGMRKQGKKVFYRNLVAVDRKRTRVERKMKRKKKVKEAFAALP